MLDKVSKRRWRKSVGRATGKGSVGTLIEAFLSSCGQECSACHQEAANCTTDSSTYRKAINAFKQVTTALRQAQGTFMKSQAAYRQVFADCSWEESSFMKESSTCR